MGPRQLGFVRASLGFLGHPVPLIYDQPQPRGGKRGGDVRRPMASGV